MTKELRKQYDRARYLRLKDKILARTTAYQKANKEKHSAKVCRYFKRNAVKAAIRSATRRAEKSLRTPKWLTKTHKQQIALFYEAVAQLTKEFGIKMEVDHIVPLKGKHVSGLHVPWNLQVLSKSDNSSKNNRITTCV